MNATLAAAVRVVLVEPQGAFNVGAVARAMMNFGFSRLCLVNPQTDPLAPEARMGALHALPLLQNAQRCDTLQAALADCRFVVGTTRREGKYREEMVAPETAAAQLVEKAATGTVALVFGREDRGLHTTELDLCQRLLTIPTQPEFGSMNLAQAATVCLYELDRALRSSSAPVTEPRTPARNDELEAMLQHMRRTLTAIDYLDAQNPDHILRTFRRIFARADLDEREVRVLQGLWSRIDYVSRSGE
jgi:tRNA/rRNA methyltransferase